MESLSEIFESVPIICVAEIGINHNGSLSAAKEMITAAKLSGAHAAKIQSICSSELYSVYSSSISKGDSVYHVDDSIIRFFDKFYLDDDAHLALFEHARSIGIELFSTAFDNNTVDMLEGCKTRLYKIASCDVTNLKLIEHVASKKKPIILSTGMSSYKEVQNAVNILKLHKVDTVLLHCVSLYPAKSEYMNLRRIDVLKNMFDCPVGLSDHSDDPIVITGALFKGISMVERHFTDDYKRECPDRDVSYDSQKFRSMVDNIEQLLKIDGKGSDNVSLEEHAIAIASKRSLYASSDLKKGSVISSKDIKCKRPYAGICASSFDRIVGKKLKHDIKNDMPFFPEDIEGLF